MAPGASVRELGFAAVLRARAESRPEDTAFVFLEESGRQRALSYAELDERARAVAATIQAASSAGERALLVFPPGDDYIVAVFGCLLAGTVAVPVFPPDPARLERTMPRLEAVARDAHAGLVLTTEAGRAVAGAAFASIPLILATDSDPSGMASKWRARPVGPADVALLQYTSGSTASPRGVMLSHSNLFANSEFIRRAFGHSAKSQGVSWLPPYHDMGLIGGILQPVYAGFPCVLMSPLTFLRRPLRWLQAISEHRATTSGGPDFAFARCVRHATAEQSAELDLSAWQVAFTGSEPVRAETLDAFSEAFAGSGFRREAFYPCYGLAEATLMVTGADRERAPRSISVDRGALECDGVAVDASESPRARSIVSCGRPGEGHRVLIADPATGMPQQSGHVGEIWVSGLSVASGYWERPDETRASFGASPAGSAEDGFLRTGDLGFVLDGELFVTGRIKELVIVGGRNHYPADIEFACEAAVPALRRGCGAAFGLHEGGHERVAIVYEVHELPPAAWDAVIQDMRAAVTRALGPPLDTVVLVRTRTVPKTSSGKVQRSLCRSLLLSGGLDVVAEWSASG